MTGVQTCALPIYLAGYRWKAVATPDDVAKSEPADGWAGAVVACDSDPEGGWAICRSLRKREIPVGRILVLVTGAQLPDLELRDDLFDDFCLAPFHPRELEARLRHLFFTHHVAGHHSFVEYAGLVLNLETYQASFGGTPLDLTYMEYELLKFLAQKLKRSLSWVKKWLKRSTPVRVSMALRRQTMVVA